MPPEATSFVGVGAMGFRRIDRGLARFFRCFRRPFGGHWIGGHADRALCVNECSAICRGWPDLPLAICLPGQSKAKQFTVLFKGRSNFVARPGSAYCTSSSRKSTASRKARSSSAGSKERVRHSAARALRCSGRSSSPLPCTESTPCRLQINASTLSRIPLSMCSACNSRARAMLERTCNA
jgi:hypothetical protein